MQAVAHAFPLQRVGRCLHPDQLDALVVKTAQRGEQLVGGGGGIVWHAAQQNGQRHLLQRRAGIDGDHVRAGRVGEHLLGLGGRDRPVELELDERGVILRANEAFCRMVGLELPILAMEHQYLITEEMPEVVAFNKANVEAYVEAGKVAYSGAQTATKEAVAVTRTNWDATVQHGKALAAVKSPTDFFKLQGDFARAQMSWLLAIIAGSLFIEWIVRRLNRLA